MIRLEFFIDTEAQRFGVEAQAWRFNFQINLGFSLLWEFKIHNLNKPNRVKSLFTGLGPLAVVGWINPKGG